MGTVWENGYICHHAVICCLSEGLTTPGGPWGHGEGVPSYRMVNKWDAEFKCGRESREDDPCPRSCPLAPQRTTLKDPWHGLGRLTNNIIIYCHRAWHLLMNVSMQLPTPNSKWLKCQFAGFPNTLSLMRRGFSTCQQTIFWFLRQILQDVSSNLYPWMKLRLNQTEDTPRVSGYQEGWIGETGRQGDDLCFVGCRGTTTKRYTLLQRPMLVSWSVGVGSWQEDCASTVTTLQLTSPQWWSLLCTTF